MELLAGGKSEMRFHEDRRALLNALLKEEEVACTFKRDEKVKIRVCSAGPDGQPTRWRMTERGDPAYDYRVILRSQIVFDQGDHGNWSRARRDAHAIWDVLNDFLVRSDGTGNGQYWGSITGGKGIHTDVFIRPFSIPHVVTDSYSGDSIEKMLDLRIDFAQNVLAACRARLPFDDRLTAILLLEDAKTEAEKADIMDRYAVVEADPRLLAPKGDQLVREFGARKKPNAKNRKVLWTVGPGPYRPLPETREAAYTAPSLPIPTKIVPSEQPPGVFHAIVRETLGGVCPKGPQCFPGLFDERNLDGICLHCPGAC